MTDSNNTQRRIVLWRLDEPIAEPIGARGPRDLGEQLQDHIDRDAPAGELAAHEYVQMLTAVFGSMGNVRDLDKVMAALDRVMDTAHAAHSHLYDIQEEGDELEHFEQFPLRVHQHESLPASARPYLELGRSLSYSATLGPVWLAEILAQARGLIELAETVARTHAHHHGGTEGAERIVGRLAAARVGIDGAAQMISARPEVA